MPALNQSQQSYLLTRMPQWMWPRDPTTNQPTDPSTITDPARKQQALNDFMWYVREQETQRANAEAAGRPAGNASWLNELDPDGGIRTAAQQHWESQQPQQTPAPATQPPPQQPNQQPTQPPQPPAQRRGIGQAEMQRLIEQDRAMVRNGGVPPPVATTPPPAPAPTTSPAPPPTPSPTPPASAGPPATTPPAGAVSSRYRRRVNRIQPPGPIGSSVNPGATAR